MLRFIVLACLTAFVVTAPVFAQTVEDASATGVEIGTRFGFSRLSSERTTASAIGVPVTIQSVPGNPSLYVWWFPSEQLAIGPEFSFGRVSDEDGSLVSIYLGGQAALFFQSNAVSGPYLLGHGALFYTKDSSYIFSDDSDSALSAGAGLGYQWRVGPAFVVKAEGRYQRWSWSVNDDFDDFDGQVNEFSLTLSLGTRLSGR